MAKMKIANLLTLKSADISIEDMRNGISAVTLDDVINVANRIEVEKVFLLGGNDNA